MAGVGGDRVGQVMDRNAGPRGEVRAKVEHEVVEEDQELGIADSRGGRRQRDLPDAEPLAAQPVRVQELGGVGRDRRARAAGPGPAEGNPGGGRVAGIGASGLDRTQHDGGVGDRPGVRPQGVLSVGDGNHAGAADEADGGRSCRAQRRARGDRTGVGIQLDDGVTNGPPDCIMACSWARVASLRSLGAAAWAASPARATIDAAALAASPNLRASRRVIPAWRSSPQASLSSISTDRLAVGSVRPDGDEPPR